MCVCVCVCVSRVTAVSTANMHSRGKTSLGYPVNVRPNLHQHGPGQRTEERPRLGVALFTVNKQFNGRWQAGS